jgi:hypothetical protein
MYSVTFPRAKEAAVEFGETYPGDLFLLFGLGVSLWAVNLGILSCQPQPVTFFPSSVVLLE